MWRLLTLLLLRLLLLLKHLILLALRGIETINVGAANAQISLSNINDTGITVNLSGQTTGTFDIGFETGTLVAAGSSMTVGVNGRWFYRDAVTSQQMVLLI